MLGVEYERNYFPLTKSCMKKNVVGDIDLYLIIYF